MSGYWFQQTPLNSSSVGSQVSSLSVEAKNSVITDKSALIKISLDEEQKEIIITKFGLSCESKDSKQSRPFLLENEYDKNSGASISPTLVQNLSKHTRLTPSTKRSNRMGGELTKSFTISVPQPMKYSRPNKPYSITQEITTTSFLTTSSTLATFATANFTLAALDNATSLEAVFDQYKIDYIENWIIPRNSFGTNVAEQLLYSVVDYDDSTALTTVAQAEDYSNVLASPGNMGHYRGYIPHIAIATYSGTFTSFSNEAAGWIDCASPSVQHYGIKIASQLNASAAQVYDLVTRYHVSFRNVR